MGPNELEAQLSRRRFGTLAMGGTVYFLTGACTVRGAPPLAARVAPVDIDRSYRDGLKRSAPGDQAVSSNAILAFLDDVAAAGLELHSFMLMRNDHVVAEGWWWPYAADRIHITHSLTKSVTAVGAGLAIDEGRFGLDDKVVSFFPEFVPADASVKLRAMTVRDLLVMETGHSQETSGSVWRPIKTSWVAEFFKIPVIHQPGTFFKYTSAASYMLSAIITKTTGQSMAEYLRPRFMEPLGIDKWQWDTSPGGISPGGNGLSWNTSASLKLGAVHASGGLWKGKRVLSEKWVRAATSKQSEGDADGAYGYQWWMGPDNAYFGLGLFSQFTIVFPEHNAVLALFSAIDGSNKIKPYIWKHFPAAFSGMANNEATLRQRTAGLRLLPPLIRSSSPRAETVTGKRFTVASNDQQVDWVSFDFAGDRVTYRMHDQGGEHVITAGLAEYLEQDTTMTGSRLHHEYRPESQRVVAGARWLDPDTFEMTWQFVETAFRDTLVCRFRDGGVEIDRSVNLNSAETKLPTLSGAA
ncbi:serine hydrolase [Sphingomonas sp.]|uniref:serine hydrolase domain-containing protein n=1 Tax=Sphingomonas sp. TaxID=28214 RepID=UPI002ED9B5AE